MSTENRQQRILQLLDIETLIGVDELSARFNVTSQTIRSDLRELSSKGLAARVHGGVRKVESVSNSAYSERRKFMGPEKKAMGKIAAGLIPDNCSVILNIGTSTEQVAQALTGHKDLVVLSNNINIINTLNGTGAAELILVGGAVRQSDGAIVGEDAVEFISRYKADYAVIGASALDEDGAVLDFDSREVSVARAILRNARTRILVCDSSKFSQSAPVRICDISELDYIVTDCTPPKAFQDRANLEDTKILTIGDAK